jgi:hypothetical protein
MRSLQERLHDDNELRVEKEGKNGLRTRMASLGTAAAPSALDRFMKSLSMTVCFLEYLAMIREPHRLHSIIYQDRCEESFATYFKV